MSTGAKCCIDSVFGAKPREFLHKSGQDHLSSSAPMRELMKLTLQKKRGDVGTADNRVRNAHVTHIFPMTAGLSHVQVERRAEDIPEDLDIVI